MNTLLNPFGHRRHASGDKHSIKRSQQKDASPIDGGEPSAVFAEGPTRDHHKLYTFSGWVTRWMYSRLTTTITMTIPTITHG